MLANYELRTPNESVKIAAVTQGTALFWAGKRCKRSMKITGCEGKRPLLLVALVWSSCREQGLILRLCKRAASRRGCLTARLAFRPTQNQHSIFFPILKVPFPFLLAAHFTASSFIDTDIP